MRKLVSGMIKRALEELFVEPSVPHGKSPVPYDSSVGFEGGVKRATGAIERKEGKNRVAASGSRGGGHGDFHSGTVEAGIRNAKVLPVPEAVMQGTRLPRGVTYPGCTIWCLLWDMETHKRRRGGDILRNGG